MGTRSTNYSAGDACSALLACGGSIAQRLWAGDETPELRNLGQQGFLICLGLDCWCHVQFTDGQGSALVTIRRTDSDIKTLRVTSRLDPLGHLRRFELAEPIDVGRQDPVVPAVAPHR